jgi:hypothetical protein
VLQYPELCELRRRRPSGSLEYSTGRDEPERVHPREPRRRVLCRDDESRIVVEDDAETGLQRLLCGTEALGLFRINRFNLGELS